MARTFHLSTLCLLLAACAGDELDPAAVESDPQAIIGADPKSLPGEYPDDAYVPTGTVGSVTLSESELNAGMHALGVLRPAKSDPCADDMTLDECVSSSDRTGLPSDELARTAIAIAVEQATGRHITVKRLLSASEYTQHGERYLELEYEEQPAP